MAPTNARTPIKSTASRSTQKRNSAGITPIIKIVHVYAPTLVRTDVANFRALVQEMTGNVAHAGHNIKDINIDCSTHEASISETTINKENFEARTRRRVWVSSTKAQGHTHREDGYSSGASTLQGGIEEKRETKSSYSNEEEEEGGVQIESPKSWESSCDRSVDSYFAESEACGEDQQYYFATSAPNWRQPLEIPGGFESFDYY